MAGVSKGTGDRLPRGAAHIHVKSITPIPLPMFIIFIKYDSAKILN